MRPRMVLMGIAFVLPILRAEIANAIEPILSYRRTRDLYTADLFRLEPSCRDTKAPAASPMAKLANAPAIDFFDRLSPNRASGVLGQFRSRRSPRLQTLRWRPVTIQSTIVADEMPARLQRAMPKTLLMRGE
jgi:hypothetical protein